MIIIEGEKIVGKKTPYIFVIEGLDGSGKETTTKKLYDILTEDGYKVLTVSFPMYDKWHSFLVRWFLKGKFGKSPYSVPPRIASLFYSFDRIIGYYTKVKSIIKNYDFVIFDRYSTSNMLYQGAKGKTYEDKISISNFIEFIEHKLFRIPKPNRVFVLISDSKSSREAMSNRKELDINERDINYQGEVEQFLHTLISLKNWDPIATRKFNSSNEWYPPEIIANSIYDLWKEKIKKNK